MAVTLVLSILNNQHDFILNLMKKSAQNCEKRKSKCNCVASNRQLWIQSGSFILQLPLLITNYILNLLACAGTTNHCPVKIWVYPKFIQVKNDPLPLNDSLYLQFTFWMLHCAEMFNCTDSSWKLWLNSKPFAVTKNKITRIWIIQDALPIKDSWIFKGELYKKGHA